MTPERLKFLEEARSALYINGYLSDSENKKVMKRIKKACDKAGLLVREKGFFEP